MNHTVISKRLNNLLEQRIDVKLNGNMYTAYIRISKYAYGNDLKCEMPPNEFNYFCYNKNNKITCWPTRNGEQPLNEEGKWKLEGRQEIRPGKFLLLFKEWMDICDKYDNGVNPTSHAVLFEQLLLRICETFTDRIRGVNTDLVFDIGTNIGNVYSLTPHDDSGYLLSSCMRQGSGYSCRNYAGMYHKVPDLKIVHRIVNDRVLFRALLWENVETSDGKRITFLDRIYGNDTVNYKLQEYAKDHDWAWRYFGNDKVYYKDTYGSRLHKEVPTDMINYIEDHGTPYMDSLYYLSQENGDRFMLSNYREAIAVLQECNGSTYSIFDRCRSCSVRLSPANRHVVDGVEMCDQCLKTHCSNCSKCFVLMLTENAITCADDNKTYCDACAYRQDIQQCAECGDWYRKCTVFFGHYYCTACIKCFQPCSHCGLLMPSSFFRTTRVDGIMRSRICAECCDCTQRCRSCERRFSGVLPKMPFYCPTCIDELSFKRICLEESRKLGDIWYPLRYSFRDELPQQLELTFNAEVEVTA